MPTAQLTPAPAPRTSVEIFNFASKTSPIPLNTSVKVGDLIGGKYLMESVLLQNGFALHCGGEYQNGFITNSEMVYDTVGNVSGYTGTMLTPCMNFGMAPLTNGLFLITGGATANAAAGTPGIATAKAEIYDPQDHIYLTYPSLVLPYSGNELLTANVPTGSPITGPYTWTATYGALAPVTGLTSTYTYPAQPATVAGPDDPITHQPTVVQPVIAFDTITVTATSGEGQRHHRPVQPIAPPPCHVPARSPRAFADVCGPFPEVRTERRMPRCGQRSRGMLVPGVGRVGVYSPVGSSGHDENLAFQSSMSFRPCQRKQVGR
jgi:hypothetical protein